ncbi:hypothetical protein QUC31_020433 [Theobroma cacao]|uniref:Vacuolar protein-sorting-associated protein 36 n=2 Tax=Theobroma cacao TaxID=3641 RepID=A0AB32UP36_THECC|nr:PREDICTED: vacuolar protein-sorting-associated protein 36 [Theobroma cacao]EOY30097.1 Hydroxyproline-rich glycoprotein family protein [Theobroma cacao]WRX33958.1 hypothetical protein QQP08_026445 [Theobroma cacao]
MKGRSSKQETKEGMEIDKISKLKEEPHLSGAYIRSLVKQLTSSRTKDPMNPKDPGSVDADGFNGQNLAKFGEGFSETPQTQQPQPPQQQKKQVRRRLHTSRPYQERLLNMAEARREIVTALKFHRAAMKQANEQQQQQGLQQQQSSETSHLSSPPPFEQESKKKSRRNPRIYPSNTNNFSTYNLENFSYSSCSQRYPPLPPPPPPNPYSWPASPIPFPSATDTLNFTLPNQPLGLNLNFHDFNNIDTTLYHNSNNPSIYSSSSPSSSSSPTLSVVTEEVASAAISHEVGPTAMADLAESYGGGGLHQAINDEEMAEIRSLGEQHQMEWNDTMNLVTSAWWFKFLKTMELGPEVKAEDDGYQPFDQVMEFPAWLNANDSCLQQHFNDLCPDDYFQDPALPCMDIGEIEGMDGEWLA